ncbi:MAG: hypothetical protein Q8Q36_01265 [bacterium]|nr:hypothetical protein [bacterium]
MAELAIQPGELPRGEGAAEAKRKPKSKFGVGFWILVFFAFLKDTTDFLLNLSVVGAPLTVATGFVMNTIVGLYLWAVGVRPTATKVATFGVSFIIDVFPGTSFIPATTFNLLFIRYLENLEQRPEQ